MEIGSKVKYRREFLRSIGACTGDLPFARGEIVKIKKLGTLTLAEVKWNYPTVPVVVNLRNLTEISNPENI